MNSLRRIQIALILAVVAVSPLTLNAQEYCPCVPLVKLWISSVCENWNCAMAALVTANGDPTVVAIPVGSRDARWIVLRQVTSGSYTDNSPFQVEAFDGVAEAGARYAALTSDFKPHMMSSPDGKILIISLRQPENDVRRRAAGH